MNTIKSIRERLGVTQSVLAVGMGCTQGNVGHYERGQTVPPDAAKRLIDYASTLGHAITFNDIYMPELAPARTDTAQPAIETIAAAGLQGHPGIFNPATAGGLVNSQAGAETGVGVA